LDNPDGRQAVIASGVRAYPLSSEERYAGELANSLLSSGIHARLPRRVRAELGLAYSVWGGFQPGPKVGQFSIHTDTRFEAVREAIDASFAVVEELRDRPIPAEELAEAKRRVIGEQFLAIETASQRAERHLFGNLVGFPEDYFNRYAERIGQVDAEAIQSLMRRYADPERMVLVVAAPASAVRELLAGLGVVFQRPMKSPLRNDDPDPD